ncbi:MAG: hypothetical protein ACQESV_04030 [Thermodesulfobacteriota bacterium]
MQERTFQLLGLLGFILSGVFFTAAGLKSGDLLTLAGSLVWILACLIWLVPVLRPRTPKGG